MKNYKLLTIPKDTAWERFTIRKYLPNWLLEITDGIENILIWLPTIYRDRHWDSHYIFEILKKKIELQREYLVSHNRHEGISNDNYYMTVCLNLIERVQEETYSTEYQDFHTTRSEFIPCEGGYEDSFSLHTILLTERFNEFLNIYPLVVKKLIEDNPELMNDKQHLCFLVSKENQKRCDKLLFKILENNIKKWWD